MVKVKNLKKSFGSVTAVDGLSFEVSTGEIVGFLGPNGAGKTTTMRLITGYLAADSGEVSINGQKVTDNSHDIQTQIGYLPENNPLYKEMLVSEMLTLSADLKKIPKNKRKKAFDFAVSAVAIEDVFYRPIGELSKGYKQRVGMAIAMLHQPKILIMDEPTEGLDPNQRTEIRTLIKKLGEDRTIILSTHVMQEATAVANRLLIVSRGKLVADGTPDDLTKAGKDEKIFEAIIEGTKVALGLKKLKNIKKVSVSKFKPKQYKVEIITKKSTDIQPQLSQLISSNKWIIWRLTEQHHNLEDVFQKLTQKSK